MSEDQSSVDTLGIRGMSSQSHVFGFLIFALT
jgi:hypothetical protein